jgi:TIR domain-containing protein
MKKVFICHQKEDESKIKEVIKILSLYAIDCWVDYKDLIPGESWSEKIEREINSTNAVLIFISKRANDKAGYYHKEILTALDRIEFLPPNQIFIIPILMDNESEIYPRLKKYHHIRMNEENWIEKILKAVDIESTKGKQSLANYNEKYGIYEKIKDKENELKTTWIERDKNELSSNGYRHFEEIACTIVDDLSLLKEQVGETFEPSVFYRNLKLEENEKLRERFQNETVYLDGNCICVPSRFIDKYIYIAEKDKSPSSSSSGDGKVVNHIIEILNANGEKKLIDVGDGWVNHRGIIQKGFEYDIYGDFNNLAYKIGTLKT